MSTAQQNKNMFSLENLIKLTVLIGFFYNIMSYLFEMKQDIALIKQASVYEVKDLQYQIDELKGGKRDTEKRYAYSQSMAIMPHNIELENEPK